MCTLLAAAMQKKKKQKKNHTDQPLKTPHTPHTLTVTQPFASLWKIAVDQLV